MPDIAYLAFSFHSCFSQAKYSVFGNLGIPGSVEKEETVSNCSDFARSLHHLIPGLVHLLPLAVTEYSVLRTENSHEYDIQPYDGARPAAVDRLTEWFGAQTICRSGSLDSLGVVRGACHPP